MHERMAAREIRAYDEAIDLDAVARMWLECGWIEGLDEKEALGLLIAPGHTEVGVLDGEAECMVQWVPSTIRYESTDLSLNAITAVTTSHVGRKQGLASEMTARSLAQSAEAGCAVAALGIFEQGFYDKLGLATAAYDHLVTFDPDTLRVDHVPYRPPVRIRLEDWADLHDAMTNRLCVHGSVCVGGPDLFEGEVVRRRRLHALGYRDEGGHLTHFALGTLKGEYGPWRISLMAYQTTDQLLELLRMIRELGDQLRSVMMYEPPHAQLQNLVRNPIRERDRSLGSEHESGNRALAWWQLRILDVAACVAARRWVGEPLSFNLTLTDPAERWLADADWSGVAGDYTVTIGSESTAVPGHGPGLPLLRASVASFTRLWFGVARASTLVVSDGPDGLEAPPDLVARLDDAFLLPTPVPGWPF